MADLRALVEAYFAALAGDGHAGVPHDRLLHEVGRHDETCPGNRSDDCSNCAGQCYGTESDLHDYLAARPHPSRADFDRMTDDEFNAYLEERGIDVRVLSSPTPGSEGDPE